LRYTKTGGPLNQIAITDKTKTAGELASELELLPGELPAERNPAAVYLSTKAPAGRSALERLLNQAAELATNGKLNITSIAWHRIGYQHTSMMLNAIRESYSPATARLARAAIRGVLLEAWRLGLMPAEDYKRAADLPTVRGKAAPAGRALELAEIQAVLELCENDKTPAGARDGAILAIAYGCGLRRSELLWLNYEHYDRKAGTLVVHGKGKKIRTVYLPAGAIRALEVWAKVRGTDPGPMFYPIRKGSRGEIIKTRRLNSSNSLLKICKKRARAAKVSPFSIHDLRRSHITHLFDQGADMSQIADLVGHAHVNTTRIYDRRGEESKRKTANLIHVPYGG